MIARNPYVWIDPWAEFERGVRHQLAVETGTTFEDMARQPQQRTATGVAYVLRVGNEVLRKRHEQIARDRAAFGIQK